MKLKCYPIKLVDRYKRRRRRRRRRRSL